MFDPEDIVSPSSEPAKSMFAEEDLATPIKAKSSMFEPEDVASSTHQTELPVTGENNEGWIGKTINENELRAIADKHRVSVDLLKERAGYYGGNFSPDNGSFGDEMREGAKTLAGKALNAVPFGLHKFVDKKLHTDPNERAALDDLNELVYNKSGKLDVVADIGTQALLSGGLGALAKGGTGTLTKVLAAVDSTPGIIAQGAVAGLNESKEGQELRNTAFGVVVAGGLLGAGKTIKFGYNKIKGGADQGKALIKEAEEMIEGSDVLTEDNMLRISKAVQADPKVRAMEKVIAAPDNLEDFAKYSQAEDLAPLRQAVIETDEIAVLEVSRSMAKEKFPTEMLTREQVLQYRNWEVAKQDLVEFAQDKIADTIKTFEQASAAVKEITKQEGAEAVGRYFQAYKIGNAMRKEVAGKYSAYEPGAISRLFDFFSDNILVNRQIDKLYKGLGAEDLQKEVSKHSDGYINVKHKLLKDEKANFRNMEVAVKEGLNIRLILDEKTEAEIAQSLAGLSPVKRQAAEDFIRVMKAGRIEANADDVKVGVKGLSVDELMGGAKGYVPHIAADTKDIILRMEAKITQVNKELGTDLASLHPETLVSILERNIETNSAAADVLAGLKFLSRKAEPDSIALKQTLSNFDKVGKTRSSTEINIAAAHKREGGVPSFLLEQDPVKLINKWHNNTFKGKYLKEDLYKLRQLSQTLRAIGDTSNADYTQKYISDLSGVRVDTVATNVQNMKLAWDLAYQRKYNNAETSGAKTYYKAMQLMPQLLGVMQAGMYPFYLGAKLSNVARNLTQPLAMTAMEGASKAAPGYGLAKVFPAMMETYSLLANPKAYKALVEEMRTKGLMPAEFDPQMIKWAREGVDDELAKTDLAFLLKVKDAGARIDKLAMTLYSMSDELNRVVTYKASKKIAADLAKGNEKALATLSMYPKSVQARIKDIQKTGGVDAAGDYLAQHLLATTQFNYNRASLNEFGRTFGTLFSAFTKWPAHIVGDLGYTMKEAKGVYGQDPEAMMRAKQKLFFKYFAPLGVMVLGDVAANVTGAKDDPLFQLAMGRGSLTGFTPLASINPLAEGRGVGLVPPALQELGKTAVKAIQGQAELDDYLKVLAQGLPGGVTYQILNKHMADWDKALGTDMQPDMFKKDK